MHDMVLIKPDIDDKPAENKPATNRPGTPGTLPLINNIKQGNT